ncbi:MAG: LCP family protein [Lachnospiraceae bacterium]|nr:LCP family protein [Lachnospiraceae bacterium]
MKTLENVYGVELDYYVRVNFSSVEKFVDLLGGVNVYSAYEFTSSHLKIHFDKGYNLMNGREALEFARERYSFSAGDNQRGKNQMELIKAVLNKMMSPTMLLKFPDLMNAVSSNFQTDLSMDQLTALVRMQLDDAASWNIETYAVKTTGGSAYCYSYHGKKLYVGYINQESAAEAGRRMREVMEGK